MRKPVPLPEKVGEHQDRKGYFSRACYYRMQPAREIEKRMGFREGRFGGGWWLMFLTVMPAVHEFEFRGYTHWSDGIPEGHRPEHANDPNAEMRVRQRDAEIRRLGEMFDIPWMKDGYKGNKRHMVQDVFSLMGSERLAKAVPVAPDTVGDPDDPVYPPGTGFPQWMLTVPLPFVAAAFVGPGEVYEGNYESP